MKEKLKMFLVLFLFCPVVHQISFANSYGNANIVTKGTDRKPIAFHKERSSQYPKMPARVPAFMSYYDEGEFLIFVLPEDIPMLDVVVLDEKEMVLWQGWVTTADSEIFLPGLEGLVTIKCTDENGIHYIGSAVF